MNNNENNNESFFKKKSLFAILINLFAYQTYYVILKIFKQG